MPVLPEREAGTAALRFFRGQQKGSSRFTTSFGSLRELRGPPWPRLLLDELKLAFAPRPGLAFHTQEDYKIDLGCRQYAFSLGRRRGAVLELCERGHIGDW